LIYARDYHVALICLLPKLVFRRRLVYEINGLASEEWLMRRDTTLDRMVALIIRGSEYLSARGADMVVAVTEGLKQYLVSDLGLRSGKIIVIPNGVDTRVFYPMDEVESLRDLRSSFGIDTNEPIVLFAGNLAPWQGIDVLLDSVPIVLREVSRARFLIVGDGDLRNHLETRTKTMDLEKHVLFTGTVLHNQIPRYINMAEICVSPFVKRRNNRIGLSPMKIHEYMACGKAVVSSRVAGLDFIEREKTGILVEPENPEALGQGILELLLNPQKRASMGQRGAQVARHESDWGKRVRGILQLVGD
jgi:glycosyltransferase involved in cell wall biosynthesis